jgi:hypothetical protein
MALFGPAVLYEDTLHFLLFLPVLQLWNVIAVLRFHASYAIPISSENKVAQWGLPSLRCNNEVRPANLGLCPSQGAISPPGDE